MIMFFSFDALSAKTASLVLERGRHPIGFIFDPPFQHARAAPAVKPK
jgi:hypothetical protein